MPFPTYLQFGVSSSGLPVKAVTTTSYIQGLLFEAYIAFCLFAAPWQLFGEALCTLCLTFESRPVGPKVLNVMTGPESQAASDG